MKKVLAALCLRTMRVCGCAAALAADLPAGKASVYVPAFSWTGPYLDGYFQYGGNITNTSFPQDTAVADVSVVAHGPGVGGALGYNWELGNGFVFGVRGDIFYANLSGTGQVSGAALSIGNATNYLGNVDALLGFKCSPDGRLLCYGVGGFAFGGGQPHLDFCTLGTAASGTSTGGDIRSGLQDQV